MKNLTQISNDTFRFRPAEDAAGKFTELRVEHLNGAKRGIFISAIPTQIKDGYCQVPIFQIVNICIKEVPRKSKALLAYYAGTLDSIAAELVQAFETNGKAGLKATVALHFVNHDIHSDLTVADAKTLQELNK